MRCLPVAARFMETFKSPYPPHQRGMLIEEAAAKYFFRCPDIRGWTYIPVQWTSWFSNNDFGKKTEMLRHFLKAMSVNKKTGPYFTVVQNDDGTCCEKILSDAGCVVFGAGGVGTYPIPLLCDPHPEFKAAVKTRLASFCGSINTHPIRKTMRDVFQESFPNCFIDRGTTEKFRECINESYFSLCPRGYGKTSFRLYETIQIGGTIPVYLFTEPWLPFSSDIIWSDFCVLCDNASIDGLPDQLLSIANSSRYGEMIKALEKVRSMFTIESTLQWIERKVRSLPCR